MMNKFFSGTRVLGVVSLLTVAGCGSSSPSSGPASITSGGSSLTLSSVAFSASDSATAAQLTAFFDDYSLILGTAAGPLDANNDNVNDFDNLGLDDVNANLVQALNNVQQCAVNQLGNAGTGGQASAIPGCASNTAQDLSTALTDLSARLDQAGYFGSSGNPFDAVLTDLSNGITAFNGDNDGFALFDVLNGVATDATQAMNTALTGAAVQQNLAQTAELVDEVIPGSAGILDPIIDAIGNGTATAADVVSLQTALSAANLLPGFGGSQPFDSIIADLQGVINSGTQDASGALRGLLDQLNDGLTQGANALGVTPDDVPDLDPLLATANGALQVLEEAMGNVVGSPNDGNLSLLEAILAQDADATGEAAGETIADLLEGLATDVVPMDSLSPAAANVLSTLAANASNVADQGLSTILDPVFATVGPIVDCVGQQSILDRVFELVGIANNGNCY